MSNPEQKFSSNAELKRITRELDDADVPDDVWIGTNSTADRVTWLITRNKLNQQNSRSRHVALEQCAEVIEAALISTNSPEWKEAALFALLLAGRRKGYVHDEQP